MTELTFNDLPKVTAFLVDEVKAMRQLLERLHSERQPASANCEQNRTMSVDEAAEYLKIPKATLYDKLARGEVPAIKPGKRYLLYRRDLDKWLETRRKNPVPPSDDEQNESMLASHRRKPNPRNW